MSSTKLGANESTDETRLSDGLLDEIANQLAVRIDLDPNGSAAKLIDFDAISAFQKAANYIVVASLYLRSNALLTKPLSKTDIKPKLLGHFGTCPGLIFVYAHLTALIARGEEAFQQDYPNRRFLFVTGPGHGAPGILASLWLEQVINAMYPQYGMDEVGLSKFVKAFSWPGSPFPSHVNGQTPGAIHEGGELGYALAVAYGSIMDKPDLITAVVVGDGESETGPTATAWHAHKFIDPKESGAVLPIVHLNGFKISERTIYGTMSDSQLILLFTGYGYKVRIVDYASSVDGHTIPGDIKARKFDIDLALSLEWAVAEIKTIQGAARSGAPFLKPTWPVIILRSPKGWGGPQTLNHLPVEGSFRSHQIPLTAVAKDDTQFAMLDKWLRSYQHERYFHHNRGPNEPFVDNIVTRMLPKRKELRMGFVPEAYGLTEELNLPCWQDFAVKRDESSSAMQTAGKYLEQVVVQNPSSFRIFSPDELISNKLDAVFGKTTRNFQWDPESANKGGRVIEMLSEHTLEGFAQGYALTGRTSIFPSYEAFLGIVSTMIAQFAKFMKVAAETTFRKPTPSLTFIETSTLWRQEHNGFSHQNPGLINTLVDLSHSAARVYLPPDANCMISTVDHCLRSRNYVNLIVSSKAEGPSWLSVEEAEAHCVSGASVWPRFSTEGGVNPDIVLVGVGAEVTAEIIAASALLQKDLEALGAHIRIRMVNITDLLILSSTGQHPHALDTSGFTSLFTDDKPVVISFHGYPSVIKGLLHGRHEGMDDRFDFLGYREEGSTTTPWSMLRVNGVDRFSVAQAALKRLTRVPTIAPHIHALVSKYEHNKRNHAKYVEEFGDDPKDFEELNVSIDVLISKHK
jgi:xylulose-5-phosphate/fructose-6-phosphate phosphoketolase